MVSKADILKLFKTEEVKDFVNKNLVESYIVRFGNGSLIKGPQVETVYRLTVPRLKVDRGGYFYYREQKVDSAGNLVLNRDGRPIREAKPLGGDEIDAYLIGHYMFWGVYEPSGGARRNIKKVYPIDKLTKEEREALAEQGVKAAIFNVLLFYKPGGVIFKLDDIDSVVKKRVIEELKDKVTSEYRKKGGEGLVPLVRFRISEGVSKDGVHFMYPGVDRVKLERLSLSADLLDDLTLITEYFEDRYKGTTNGKLTKVLMGMELEQEKEQEELEEEEDIDLSL